MNAYSTELQSGIGIHACLSYYHRTSRENPLLY
jgi:hypothetical protein